MNGKIYVGVTTSSIAVRFDQHLRAPFQPNSKKTAIRSAIMKHGVEAFSIAHIASATDRPELLKLEQAVIAQLRSNIPGVGYNMTEGGERPPPMTDKQRKAISAALVGHVRSPETRLKMSQARMGKKLSPERIAKMKGRKISDEARANMRAGQARRCRGNLSDETREKLAACNRGRKHSPESIARSAAARRGQKVSDEVRARQSAAAKARWADPAKRAVAEAAISGALTGRKQSQEHKAKRATTQKAHRAHRRAIERAGNLDLFAAVP